MQEGVEVGKRVGVGEEVGEGVGVGLSIFSRYGSEPSFGHAKYK